MSEVKTGMTSCEDKEPTMHENDYFPAKVNTE
jgi:hypothetical protein